MANEFQFIAPGDTGSTLYYLRPTLDANNVDISTGALIPFANLNPDDLSNVAIRFIDSANSGYYFASMIANAPAGTYYWTVYRQVNLVPMETDPIVSDTPAPLYWSGEIALINPNPSTALLSYSAPAEGDSYFATILYATAWTTATSTVKQQALSRATMILDSLAWKGRPTSSTQPHSFPRTGLYFDFVVIDPNTVPLQIIIAQFEIAIALLKGYDPERDMRNVGVISRGYSSVRVAYDPKQVPDYLRWGIPSITAWNLIRPFLDMDVSEAVRLHRV